MSPSRQRLRAQCADRLGGNERARRSLAHATATATAIAPIIATAFSLAFAPAFTLAFTTGVLSLGCLADRPEPERFDPTVFDDPVERGAAIAQRIERLEEEIARDRDRLALLVSEPGLQDEQSLHENATLRELAASIAARAAELDRLRTAADRANATR